MLGCSHKYIFMNLYFIKVSNLINLLFPFSMDKFLKTKPILEQTLLVQGTCSHGIEQKWSNQGLVKVELEIYS
jgi:hypothetical protein